MPEVCFAFDKHIYTFFLFLARNQPKLRGECKGNAHKK